MQIENQNVYECVIRPINCYASESTRGYVLFDSGRKILLSDLVNDCGKTVRTACEPPVPLDAAQFCVEAVAQAQVGKEVYTNLNDAAKVIVEQKGYGAIEPNTGHVRVYRRMSPPRPTLVHRGFIETNGTRYSVGRYGDTDQYRLTDQGNGQTVDICGADLVEYFK